MRLSVMRTKFATELMTAEGYYGRLSRQTDKCTPENSPCSTALRHDSCVATGSDPHLSRTIQPLTL